MPLSPDPIVCLAVACEPMGRLASESFDIPVPRAKRLSCDCVERPGNERLDLCIYPWCNSRCQTAIFVFHGGSSGSSRHPNLLLRSRLILYDRTRLGQGFTVAFPSPRSEKVPMCSKSNGETPIATRAYTPSRKKYNCNISCGGIADALRAVS